MLSFLKTALSAVVQGFGIPFLPALLAVAALGAWAGWTVNGWRLEGRIESLQAESAAVFASQQAALLETARASSAKAALETRETALKESKTVEAQIVEKTRYVQTPAPVPVCVLPDARFRLLLAAVARANASARLAD